VVPEPLAYIKKQDNVHLMNRGQIGLWNSFLGGILILGIFGFVYLLLNQIFVNNLVPAATFLGTDSGVMNWLNNAWIWIVIAVIAAFVYGQISNAKVLGSQGSWYE
jgi:hypothetical protein